MKKPYKTFMCSKLVAYISAIWSVTFVPWIVITVGLLAEGATQIKNVVMMCLCLAILLALFFLPHRRAFSIVSFDRDGVKNKNMCIKWNEIGSVYSIDLEILKYRTIPYVPLEVICISTEPQITPLSFWRADKNRIFVSMNKKNFRMLAKYACGTSPSVDRFISEIQARRGWNIEN